MEYTPLFFSLLFFTAFAFYLFFGIYIIYINPGNNLNRIFLAVCVSLCFWSLGFSIATSAPSLETCHIWRRVSAIGWGSLYCLFVHFLLLLTAYKIPLTWRKFYPLIYLPGVISVCAFALSNKITATQYNLIQTDHGWINVAVQNNWTTFFNIYYGSYALACLLLLWNWRRKTQDRNIHIQANTLFIALALALVLGSLTDVILSAKLHGPLPQMAPIFLLLPIVSIFYFMQRYSLMKKEKDPARESILSEQSQSRLYYYLATAYMAASFVVALAYFFPDMLHNENNLTSILFAGISLFAIGMSILLAQLIKNSEIKKAIVLIATLLSIPIITFQFVDSAAVTVWAFPLILIIISLTFSTRTPLLLLTVVAVVTQLLLWVSTPGDAMEMNEFDYIIRIGIILIAYLVGSFVNRAYTGRLKENIEQVNFQKMISEITFDFVSVNQNNLDKKINTLLREVGSYFNVERTYISLVDPVNGTISYIYEWRESGIPKDPKDIKKAKFDMFPWSRKQLERNKMIYIEDVDLLPGEASAERKFLTRRKVKSAILIPMERDGETRGLLGLDTITFTKEWTADHVESMKILANLITDALAKIDSEKEIEYMAYYDSLTGLPNRTLFKERLKQAINNTKRTSKYVGVILMDLDSFKMVNDTMGHSSGDTILKNVAQSLEGHLRQTDTVARFGGDEFLIMLNNLTDEGDITQVVNHIMMVFETPFNVHGQDFYITSSAGVAVYPYDGEDPETLIKNADIAMYMAKSKGKNQYLLCTPNMKDTVKQNIKLSNDLYSAGVQNQLTIHYQPQVNLNTGSIKGLEALLRWKHPELGMVPPNVFIPLAEMNGTINGIGEWVLETAVRQNRRWQDMGLPHLRMAVNLSIIQLNNPDFVNTVARILEKENIDPKYLELEITESIAMKETNHILDVLNKLKQLGIYISIDDFGTEYSSLNRLKILPIDRIKIDMQFVQGIEGSEKDQIITKVIINLAKSLGLEVLAEGVETAPQLEFLNQRMCDDVQGFYYYKPMPAEEIEKILRSFST